MNSDMQKALISVEKAQETYKLIELDNYPNLNPWDQYLYFKSLAGIGYAYFFKGDKARGLATGTTILNYGQRHSNIRSIVMGHFVTGLGFFVDGDFPPAIEAVKKFDFFQRGELKNYAVDPEGNKHDMVIMIKRLHASWTDY